MPCDEDFERRDTNVRKDFLRRWYHTRSKKVKAVSLEACMEDEEHGIHEIEDISSSFEDSVVAEDFCQRFKARLSEKDLEILELRVLGFTYEEIADKLGYKNHSGVIKRIRSIAKAFEKYEERQ
jgi:DNA-directed RNA polymerase specialized sigma24 family protein